MENVLFRGLLIATVSSFCLVNPTIGDDWPVWRGPNRNGISKEKNWNPKGISNVLWAKRIGVGYSAFTVKGKRAYTMGNTNNQDHIYCLDAETGNELWKYSYPCPKGGGYAGPRATPVIDDGCIYCFSNTGEVHCISEKDGKKKWVTKVSSLGAQNITWHYASSPRVTKDLVIVNAGKYGIALSKKNGRKVWSSTGKGGYASPVIMGKQAFLFGEKALFSVDLDSGKENWSFPWQTQYFVNAADPTVSKKWVLISSGYGRGCAMLDITSGGPEKRWENKSMSCHFSSPVYVDGYIYGVDGNAGGGALVCLEEKTGKEKWRKNLGFGSFIAAGDKIIYINEGGKLTVGTFSPSGFDEIASAQVLKAAGKCWTMPILSNGKIFCRGSNGKTVCLDVRK